MNRHDQADYRSESILVLLLLTLGHQIDVQQEVYVVIF